MSKEEKSLKSWLKAGRAAYSVSDACGEAGKRIATVGAIILLGGALAAIVTDFCYNRVEAKKRKIVEIRRQSNK